MRVQGLGFRDEGLTGLIGKQCLGLADKGLGIRV